MSNHNPLRKVFWDTFNATRTANNRTSSDILTAFNSLVGANMNWIGHWEISALDPANGQRRVGEKFVTDPSGEIHASVTFYVEVRDMMGAFPHLNVLELNTRFVIKEVGAAIFIASDFKPDSFYDVSQLKELAQEVLRGLDKGIRDIAVLQAP